MQSQQPGSGRTLVLMRHAQAGAAGPTDHERPLTAAGMAAAADLGVWLAARGVVPELVLVSDATRTQQTWAEAAGAAGWHVTPTTTAALYAAGPDTVLDLLQEVPDDITTVVVVGHNPTVAYLAGMLDNGLGDAQASTELVTGGYAPGTATVFDVAVSWSGLREQGATLRLLHVGG
jgi:phosphohistidine phosphatase